MAEKEAYCQAASTGKYEKPSGLLGKYDNVRRFWEDRLSVNFLAPILNEMVRSRKDRPGPLRIIDLGCGSGDGLELLTSIPVIERTMRQVNLSALDQGVPKRYVGLDLNEDLITQAEACHGSGSDVSFVQGDLSSGLPSQVTELESFDLYFTSYGTLSHFHDSENAKIIADVCEHAGERAIFVGDWLGRYSYEWRDLWTEPADREYFMDYKISYIYPEEERHQVDVASFPLRLMTRDEILRVVSEAESLSGARIKPLKFFDRSILIGRHMDTSDYNPYSPKIRFAVNSLFEQSRRTDFNDLMVNYQPLEGYGDQNRFFEEFFGACNRLVNYTARLLDAHEREQGRLAEESETPYDCSTPLARAMDCMRKMVDSVSPMDWLDQRANLIEPMLAYCLRRLEIEMQPGAGYGHSLVGIFEIQK